MVITWYGRTPWFVAVGTNCIRYTAMFDVVLLFVLSLGEKSLISV